MSKGWDSMMLKKLKVLAGKGLSTSEIGKRLGVSKNAVIGKLNRLGWNSKAGGAPVGVEIKGKKKTAKKIAKSKTGAVAPKGRNKTAIKTNTKKTIKAHKKITPAKKPTSAKKAKITAKPKVEKKVATKTSSKSLAMHQRIIQHSLEMANLKPNFCRWPIGDPDSEDFHFCGAPVFVGKPYCYEHCKQAYQFTPPKKK